ncbi:ejaculatory bulb-specific protein 3-like [Schistocerca piceifrons]|uniref:ejaculatory bulb-specific protein 3-like n=1 Tax=Schistocerca piceifrons TaxID=274613 RepID=UPI001F5E6DA1|nr:ejaculatory bulb-specific protein 3-like [Schistocerca piceifrons]
MELAVAALSVLLLATLVAAAPPDKYDARYDHMDVDAVLRNQRILASYIKCMLDTGPCTPEGRALRKHMPEALRTNCDKCTDAQKKIVRKLSLHVREHQPVQWDLLSKKYDPEHQYHDSFEKFLDAAA